MRRIKVNDTQPNHCYFLRHQLIVLCQQSIHHPRIQWEHCTLDGWMVATGAFEIITHGICLLTHQKRWKALGWEGRARRAVFPIAERADMQTDLWTQNPNGNGWVPDRHRHRIDRSSEFCIYHLIALSLNTWIITKPVNPTTLFSSRHALHTTGFEGGSKVARTHPVI